ncbi:MAG: hypothetical protein OEY09_04665 [Gammaproteobacteria bacterium]|nr:hypothetical protein [Gammaproteobacteria bacterium]
MKVLYFALTALMFIPSTFAQNAENDAIPFKTVEEALKALESDAGAELTEYEGWKIFKQKNKGRYVLWSFTPPEHPAHPTVVRRTMAKINGQLNIDMDVLCYSTQIFCDSLMEDFKQINEAIKQRESSGS